MRVLLAPMEGVLDSLVRELLTEVNDYDSCITEFLRVVDQLLPVKSFYRLCPELHQHQRAARRPAPASASSCWDNIPSGWRKWPHRAVALGSWGVDLNRWPSVEAGKRQRRRATLLKDPELIHRGAKAGLREAVPEHLPVTVKVRLGWDSGERRFEIADAVQQAGASELRFTAVPKRRWPKSERINSAEDRRDPPAPDYPGGRQR
ncbi:tRNA-dihydrouridine synthase [Klebsiella pneumoniae]|nr:tRNA-dihydrouridine synthase [Klebsiella pneumoniae]